MSPQNQNRMMSERVFSQTLIGRVLADDIYMGQRSIAIRNQAIGIGLVNRLIILRTQAISIRTPFTFILVKNFVATEFNIELCLSGSSSFKREQNKICLLCKDNFMAIHMSMPYQIFTMFNFTLYCNKQIIDCMGFILNMIFLNLFRIK